METGIIIFLAALFGLLIGSFLNVVIYRLPIMLDKAWTAAARQQLNLEVEEQAKFNLLTPPSRCGNCGSAVRPWQNIPVISWLALRGRCASCRHPISIRYPLVEMLTAVMFGLMAWKFGESWVTVGACLFSAFIVALVFIDADTQLLPDDLTLPLVWLGLLFNWQTGFVSLPSALLGAVCGYMSLWLLFHLFKLLTGKDGMGYGDFKMLAAIGAWLGVAILPIVVLAAALVGIVAALVKRLAKSQPMAFGPCLGIAGWLVFLLHEQTDAAIRWWLHSSGFQ